MLSKNNLSILIRGRPGNEFANLIANIRTYTHYPLIGSLTPEFSNEYHQYAFNKLVYVPDPGELPGENNKHLNRQIVTIKEGLKQVDTEYVLVLRADLLLFKWNILDTFKKYDNDHRLLISSVFTVNSFSSLKLPYHIGDWFILGKTKNVKKLYNIPLHKAENVLNKDGHLKYRSEQYVTINWLRNQGMDIDIPRDEYDNLYDHHTWEAIVRDNFITFDPTVENGLINTKYVIRSSDQITDQIYSHRKWLELQK